ncbi:Uncharacterised protein [Mycobacteroides abscessus subsp. abscessus]|nr:Uncharacterised protein [Mycobacteroides abscessus subsp. abscessus]
MTPEDVAKRGERRRARLRWDGAVTGTARGAFSDMYSFRCTA